MTTATDVLRKLLDECGIEWKDGDAAYEIEWSTPDGRHCSAMYWKPTFSVLISGCTPEQAIAATLGDSRADYHGYEQAAIEAWESIKAWNSRAERTCKIETDHDELEVIAYSHEDTWAYRCSACDWSFRYDRGIKPSYCPNCGARVVE